MKSCAARPPSRTQASRLTYDQTSSAASNGCQSAGPHEPYRVHTDTVSRIKHTAPGADTLSPGKPVSGPAKTYPSRQNGAFLQRANEGLTARLNGDRRRDSRKPRRNDEPQRDARRTGSTSAHRPARRRYRRRVQLCPGPGDQLAERPRRVSALGELVPAAGVSAGGQPMASLALSGP